MTDQLLTKEQEELRAMVHEFAEKEIIPAAAHADETGEFPLDTVKKAAKMGLTCLTLPRELGGLEVDYQTLAVVKEELGWGDIGFNTTLGACALATLPVKIAGNDYHMKKVADVLTGGGLTAFALTEPQAGSDAGGMLSTAVRHGDKYILNGNKCFCTNGAYADLYTIFASVNLGLGTKGITAFLVEACTPGLKAGKEENKMGARSSNTTDLFMEDVEVPVENMLGAEGKGFKIALQTLGQARCSTGAAAIGSARYALEYALKYSSERKTFGKPICQQQSIQHMIADCYTQLEAGRQLVAYACRLVDNKIIDASVSSAAKTFATDAGMKIVSDAIQIMGGYGFSREYPLEKRYRDAKITQIWEGTNQIQRNVIAGDLISRLPKEG